MIIKHDTFDFYSLFSFLSFKNQRVSETSYSYPHKLTVTPFNTHTVLILFTWELWVSAEPTMYVQVCDILSKEYTRHMSE